MLQLGEQLMPCVLVVGGKVIMVMIGSCTPQMLKM